MLRRTFLGTLAALPIVGVPFRAIGLAVSFETCRFTIRWESEPDAPDIVIALYSDESVRCWLGATAFGQAVIMPALQKQQKRWSFSGSDGEWNVYLTCRCQDAYTIDVERITLWNGGDYDPHFGLAQQPLPKDYGIGYWIDLDDSGSE